jgi:hypothetical protein
MAIKSSLLNRRVWTPAQLTEQLWLDASDSSTFTLNTDKVAEWRDKSGNNRHFGQSTDTSRPTVISLDDRQYIRFNGTNQQLLSTAFPSSAMVCVFRKTHSTASALFSTSNTATGTYFIIGTSPTGNIRIQQSNNTNVVFPFNNNINNFNLVAGNKNTTPIRIAGSTVATNRNASVTITSTGASIGRAVFSGNTFFRGEIGELLLFNQTVTTNEFELLEGYLAFKWGLQSTLPSEHPYKNTCPFV